ncbi:hypothetical protein HDU87_001921 [Geranomyces variabilis]|uniref:Uncharacterized protein n=1 Tax=Geranomyces variabilis TaxID=109894 RepID=A0AAD5TB62_9FUNG|nr:hypothetical protein HDU87_001921 [Geranomyces variabilis]
MVYEFDEHEYLHPGLTLKGLISQLKFCKEGIASFHDETADSKLASAEKVIRGLREFFGPREPYFIQILDQTIDALTERGSNGQRHVRQAHLLDELTRNFNFGKSELADLKSLGAVERLSMMEEVFASAQAIYRNNEQELPAFIQVMELTLDALTVNFVDEYGERRRRVREVVSPNANVAPLPSPGPSELVPALPALVDEEEEENDAIRENRRPHTKLSSSDVMETDEPRTQVKPADDERLAERAAERVTSREMVLKEHPAYRKLISEWLAHSSTLPFEVTTQQSIQVGVRNLVLGIGHNLCHSHASLFWTIIRYVALHHKLKRASKVEKNELIGIMKQAKLHSCEMERRYAGFFAELYDVLGGGFLIVAARDLVALRKSFKPFKGSVRFTVPVRDKFKVARRSFEECIDCEDSEHSAGLTVYDKVIKTMIDAIIADDQPCVDAAIQAFQDTVARP